MYADVLCVQDSNVFDLFYKNSEKIFFKIAQKVSFLPHKCIADSYKNGVCATFEL